MLNSKLPINTENGKILIVEDENIIAAFYQKQLARYAYIVKLASNGNAALELLKKESFSAGCQILSCLVEFTAKRPINCSSTLKGTKKKFLILCFLRKAFTDGFVIGIDSVDDPLV